MGNRKLFKAGACGAGVAAVCCFTPALVVLLPAIGLGAWLAWADYVLWPLLVISLGVMGYALWVGKRRQSACNASEEEMSS
ncbi:MAG: mercury resistance system transport protein MerF [Gammaproteobacteria bacterium]